MNSLKTSSLVALCSALVFLAGCATEPESHVVSAPPPPSPGTQQVVVAQQPQQVIVTQQQPQQVVTTVGTSGVTSYVVLQAPPAAQPPEAIPARPTSQHVWVVGHWTWQNNRYEWMAGHWEVPPYSGANWVAPRSESEGGAIRFYEGHWN